MPLVALPPELFNSPVATHQLADSDWASGRSLSDLHLRAATGASVVAIRREGQNIPTPDADERLAAGDVLYLLGDDASVIAARERLTRGESSAANGDR